MTQVDEAQDVVDVVKAATADEEILDATAQDFEEKRPHTSDKVFRFPQGLRRVHFQAIGRKEYDLMLSKCPPSTAQRAKGDTYDQDKFAPMIMARVITAPALNEAAWRNVWNDDSWNRAELGNLFFAAVDVCSVGLNVDPTESG